MGATAAEVEAAVGFPAIVKPSKQGSTVGLTLVRDPGKLGGLAEGVRVRQGPPPREELRRQNDQPDQISRREFRKIVYGPDHPRIPWLAHDLAVFWMLRGYFDVALDIVRHLGEHAAVTVVNSVNPFRLEGQKSIMYRILEACDWTPPDWRLSLRLTVHSTCFAQWLILPETLRWPVSWPIARISWTKRWQMTRGRGLTDLKR